MFMEHTSLFTFISGLAILADRCKCMDAANTWCCAGGCGYRNRIIFSQTQAARVHGLRHTWTLATWIEFYLRVGNQKKKKKKTSHISKASDHVSHNSLQYSLWSRRKKDTITASQNAYSVIMFVGENRMDWLYAFTIMRRQSIITLQSHQTLDINHNYSCLQNIWSAKLCFVAKGWDLKQRWEISYRTSAVAALIRDSQRFL